MKQNNNNLYIYIYILGFLKSNKLSLVISLLYFLILLPFYYKSYEVPDFFVYENWAKNHLLAQDAYSSTFILLSKLCLNHPHLVQLMSLMIMTAGLFLFLSSQEKIKQKFYRILYVVFILSLGAIYYFYGKIWCDFPFVFLLLSIIYRLSLSEKCPKLLCFLLAGLLLSFKPYAIFGMFSLYLLLLIYKKEFLYDFKSVKKILADIVMFILGYIIGMWGLVCDFITTVNGIFSLHSSSKILIHLFNNKQYLWDHVTNCSVNMGACNIITVIGIFFIIPAFIKNRNKYYLIFANLFLCIMYYIFIKFFSTGLLFHSFPFSLYLICILGYILIYESQNFSKIQKYMVFAFVALQFINNFAIYLPLEVRNFVRTDKAYKAFDKNKEELVKKIYENIEKNDKIEVVYNLQRRDIKSGKYIHERANNYNLILPYIGDNTNYNKFYFIEYEKYTKGDKNFPIGYFYNLKEYKDKNILMQSHIFRKNMKEIYSKGKIKIYAKKTDDETFKDCIR